MAEERKTSRHTVTMDRRENISVSGVIDVLSFDEETVAAETEMGVLLIHGINLHVNKLNLDSGELQIDGEISTLMYEEESSFSKNKTSFFSKIFK